MTEFLNQARWLWCDDGQTVNQYVQFKRVFSVEDVTALRQAAITLTADTNYALWCNGRFVDCGVYQCGENRFAADRLELLPFLRTGSNVLAITVFFQGEGSSQYYRKWPGLIFRAEIGDRVLVSDEKTFYRTDPGYQQGPYFRTTPQLGFNFCFHSGAEDLWKTSPCMEEGFAPACCRIPGTETIIPRPVAKCSLLPAVHARLLRGGAFLRKNPAEENPAQAVQADFLQTLPLSGLTDADGWLRFDPDSDGLFLVYDLGREEAGYLTLTLEAGCEAVLDIAWGEHLEDLRVRAKIGSRNFAHRYFCRPGNQTFTHWFTRIAGRYLQIHIPNPEQPMKLPDVGIVPCIYPLKQANSMVLRDSLLQQIHDTACRTLQLCMHEHYEDTPWREQALYAMDSRNQALFGYYAFSEYTFAKASLTLLGESLREDHYLRITAPTEHSLTIPYFSMMWIVAVQEYFLYSGDDAFASRWLPQTEQMLDCYLARQADGLPVPPEGPDYWNFYDWAEGLDGEHPDLTAGAEDALYPLFLLLALQRHDEMARFCDAKTYTPEISRLQQSLRQRFWVPQRQLFASFRKNGQPFHFCQLTQALAILTGTCPEAQRRTLAEQMLSCPDLVKATLSLSIFKIQALMFDRSAYAGAIVREIGDVWGAMLLQGATSFWETEQGAADFNGAGSLSHGWSTLPIYVNYAVLEGIVPTVPGFREYRHAPVASPIESCTLKTPAGIISRA